VCIATPQIVKIMVVMLQCFK